MTCRFCNCHSALLSTREWAGNVTKHTCSTCKESFFCDGDNSNLEYSIDEVILMHPESFYQDEVDAANARVAGRGV